MQLVEALVRALMFYADVDTYFAIGFFPDRPCGDFVNDFDKLRKPGAKARKVLKAYRSQIAKELSTPAHNKHVTARKPRPNSPKATS